MKENFFIGAVLFFVAITFGLRLILIMSYSSYDDLMRIIENLLRAQGSVKKTFGRMLQALIASRIIVGVASVLAVMAVLIFK